MLVQLQPGILMNDLPVRKTMCQTCPFRHGSKYANLAPALTESAMTEASRICHSTGQNAIHEETGVEEHLCRGARDIQLRYMACAGVISEATDEAWNERRAEIGMCAIEVCDPPEVIKHGQRR